MFKDSKNFSKSSIHWQIQGFECVSVLGAFLNTTISTMKSGFSVEAWCCTDTQLNHRNSNPCSEHTASWISESLYYCNVVFDKAYMCCTKIVLRFFSTADECFGIRHAHLKLY